MRRVSFFLLLLSSLTLNAADYRLGPDSQRNPSVPRGAVAKSTFAASKIFPGSTRDYWVYVPAQYDPSKPACLMIFQDGGGFVKDDGSWRAAIVLDNLIAQKAMPVTIGLFIDPGVLPPLSPNQQSRVNRSYEYDSLGSRYAKFLIDEMIPEVAKQYNLSSNPDDRGIAGSSSGAIAAFTAAWTRPDAFHRVMSFVGSYTDLKGGDVLPNEIRKTEPKPLRIFLQDGDHDLNIYAGSWWFANQTMFSALQYVGYESKFVTGTEGHNAKHGGSILPDALRWLWQDYPKPISTPRAPESPQVSKTDILEPGRDWELVGQGYKFSEGPAVDKLGNVYFCDVANNKIYKVPPGGDPIVFRDDAGGTSGLMFGPDGRLYGAEAGKRQIVSWSPDGGPEKVLASGVDSNDLAVTSKGAVYFTDPPGHRVWLIDPDGRKRVVHEGLAFPNGVRFSPDESLLMVADTWNRWVWSFQVQPDGSLANGEPFYRMEMIETGDANLLRSGADGMAFDTEGFLYVATKWGIQVCDTQGRVVFLIRTPGAANPSNLVFAGPDMRTLYVTVLDKVYRRHLLRKGFYPWTPIVPAKPQP